MKIEKWKFWTAISFILLSTLFYVIHYFLFRDAHHIFLYLVGDIAFVFIEVLMVSLILEQILAKREIKSRMEKLNMVIGVFFSELGVELLKKFADTDPQVNFINNELIINKDWINKDFNEAKSKIRKHDFSLKVNAEDLKSTHDFLNGKIEFLLQILENPTLLEHESFTDMLQATFHLHEELRHRVNFDSLPETDIKHLQGDCERVYSIIMLEWLSYTQHLLTNYPYLFSMAMRTNPFDKNCCAIVNE